LRTDVAGTKPGIEKGAACCRLPGSDGPWEHLPLRRSPRWTAHIRAQFTLERVVDGVVAHGSQARRQSHDALPPCLSGVPCAVHDRSSMVIVLAGISLTHPTTEVNAFPKPFVPTILAPPARRTPRSTGSIPPYAGALCVGRRTIVSGRSRRQSAGRLQTAITPSPRHPECHPTPAGRYPIRNLPHPPATLLPRPQCHPPP